MSDEANTADAPAPDVQAAAPPPVSEPPVTTVSDAPEVEPPVTTISDAPDAQPAAAQEEVFEEKMVITETITETVSVQPVLSKTAAEIETGRLRVQEHEGRQALRAGKDSTVVPEENRVAAAGAANSEL